MCLIYYFLGSSSAKKTALKSAYRRRLAAAEAIEREKKERTVFCYSPKKLKKGQVRKDGGGKRRSEISHIFSAPFPLFPLPIHT